MQVGKTWHDRFPTPINTLSRRITRQQLSLGTKSSDTVLCDDNGSVIMDGALLIRRDNRRVMNDGLHAGHCLHTIAASAPARRYGASSGGWRKCQAVRLW